MIVDLHNHTALCNHAEGENEEYIKKAIQNGTKYFGFSDHAPMNFDKNYRMSFEQMGDYERDIKKLQEKYKDKINILLGYEVDYLDGYLDSRVLNAKVDYLIGSVHFLKEWGFDNPEFIGHYKSKDIDKIWQEYFEAVMHMAKSGHFSVVGHIDLIKVFNYLPKKEIKNFAHQAVKEIKKADLVVELNSSGLRKPCKEVYPGNAIMELLSEYDVPITFSSDAHKPKDVGYAKDKLIAYAKSYGYSKCAYFIQKDRKLINF